MYVACHVCLAVCEECFDVAHDRIEVLSFVQPVAVELPKLILPAQLPFREDVFFERVVRFNDDYGCSRFESNTPFNANDSITNMYITAYGVGAGDFLQMLDGLHRVFELLAVDGTQFALFKSKNNLFTAVAGKLRGKGALRKHAQRVERFFAAH